MQMDSQVMPLEHPKRRVWMLSIGLLLIALLGVVLIGRLQDDSAKTKTKKSGPVQVVCAVAAQADVALKLMANGTVSALQTVEVRPQISATIKAVHIKEGQFVRKGERLFTLDTRTEVSNLNKAEAQLAKDRADLANAERNFQRQLELFQQKFISQAALDTAQNQVDGLRGQLAVDQAAAETSRVALSFGEIAAPISGRTGVISVYPGSLVQANASALVNITQIDPINVSFTLPEQHLAAVQQAFAKGPVAVSATLESTQLRQGRLAFVDNAVDAASGTIRLKAEFHNTDHRLWPGMFVTVVLAPQTLPGAISVPVQAVQTGPEQKFIYVIGDDRKAASVPIHVRLIQDGIAVVEGIAPGTRVVVEGAQNLRPGSVVTEAKPADAAGKSSAKGGKKSKKKNGSGGV